jgi:hypothetical protein
MAKGLGPSGRSSPARPYYVIDVMPDFVMVRDDATGATENIQVVQIWVDPRYPDAHRDPALRAYLERRAAENIIGLVRWGMVEQPLGDEGMALFPPSLSEGGKWIEHGGGPVRVDTHSPEELLRALGRPNTPL